MSRIAFILMSAALLTVASRADDAEKIVLRIRVVDAAGEPVPGAAARGFFFDEQVLRERLDGNVAGSTDLDGRVEISGTEDIYVDFQVDAAGYYRSTRRVVVRDPEIRKHGSDQTIRLRKRIDPIAMRVKRSAVAGPSVAGEAYGYDLVAGDFVEPLGRGTINDLALTYVRKQGEGFDWSWALSVRFSNPGDGLIPALLHERESEFRSDHEAPRDGYLSEWNLEQSRSNMNEGPTGNVDPNRMYYFRVRTRTDPNGDVSGGHYGKIYGEFPVITYYLNPQTGSRNVEWDVTRNLFDSLPILERATAP
jgi:hypothetical protein